MNRDLTVDVIVIGGGPAGFAAAIGSAKTGAKTLLVERNPYFGGQATHSNVISYCGFFTRGEKPDQVVKGVGALVLEKLKSYGESIEPFISKTTGNASVRFNPEKLKRALDELLEESSVRYLLHTQAIGVTVNNNKITEVELIDDDGRYTVFAKAVVDATGDANIAHLSKLETMWGDENHQTQMSSIAVRIDHLPAISEVSPEEMTNAIQKGKENNIQHLHKEKGLIVQIPFEDYGFLTIPSVHVNDLRGETLTACEVDLRKQADAYVSTLKKYIPSLSDIRLVSTGPAIGIRESRRIIGNEILNYKDVLCCKKRDDSIARGGWSPEIHKDIKELTYIHLADNDYFSIPFSCIQSKDIENLYSSGKSISCDHVSHSSVRVMGTGFATGHAAGIAAALCKGLESDLKTVQTELIRQNALI